MHREVSIDNCANCTLAHPSAGTSSAGVGQTAAQGIVSHMMHAVVANSSTGVPAANPCDGDNFTIACTGHASPQAPHRVHAPRNAGSGNAPGGRT